MEEERFSAKTFIRESRNPFAEILGFPRMDFRGWIFRLLQVHNLRLLHAKCEFSLKSVMHVGFLISALSRN